MVKGQINGSGVGVREKRLCPRLDCVLKSLPVGKIQKLLKL